MTMSFIRIKLFYDFRNAVLMKEIVERQFVSLRESVEVLLVLLTIVHFLAKKLLKILAFSLKSVM